ASITGEGGPLADGAVDLVLQTVGPAPAQLVFPTLAALDRTRLNRLSRVRFLRLRVQRLVMFASVTSSPEGCGWQLRLRLPPAAVVPVEPPAPVAGGDGDTSGSDGRRGAAMPRRGRAARAEAAGGGPRDVVTVPIPARTSGISGRARAGVGAAGMRSHGGGGRGAAAGASAAAVAASTARVRRGFGAADLVVGDAALAHEVVCGVDVTDATVQRWTDGGASIDIVLVDGRDRRPRGAPEAAAASGSAAPTGMVVGGGMVGPDDRVVAVGRLPLRELLASADLSVAATVDLQEVVDFWAAETVRSGVRGRGGAPLANPYHRRGGGGGGYENNGSGWAGGSGGGGGGGGTLALGRRSVATVLLSLELLGGQP
ncbi:unnamed protein product, partial [Phaeothamnion confervicola]